MFFFKILTTMFRTVLYESSPYASIETDEKSYDITAIKKLLFSVNSPTRYSKCKP